ncbi:MAG: hypothetical protein IPP72_20495 [Chitinophagaceae bacterium]|nr:hypothetical protein [Chitinophagaceae bacterium]
MDHLFSPELKELVAKARETAIDLGYDYISTIHFFIADCESNYPNSIFKFAFADDNAFKKFKTDYTLNKEDLLNFTEASLPLTKEAEKTIRLSESERMLCKQTLVYPCHVFVAALKNEESLLFQCFKHDEHALANLVRYYKEHGVFEISKMSASRIAKEYYVPGQKNNEGFINKILKLFKRSA